MTWLLTTKMRRSWSSLGISAVMRLMISERNWQHYAHSWKTLQISENVSNLLLDVGRFLIFAVGPVFDIYVRLGANEHARDL